MEIIGMGILLAIGFYLAPAILTLSIAGLLLIGSGIESIFSRKNKGK